MSFNSKYIGQQIDDAIDKVYNNDFYYYCGKDNTFDLDNLPYQDISPSIIMTSFINTYSLPNNQIGKIRYIKDAKDRNIVLIQTKEESGSTSATCQAIDGSNVYLIDIYVYAVDTPHLSCKKIDFINPIDFVKKSNVITKTNTTEYIPTEDYHPATKKYVDDLAGGDMVVVNVEDAVGPPNGYDDTTVFTFIQGDLNVLKQLILQKKYSQIIVNGVPCFGERDGNLLIYMKESFGVAAVERQYNVIAEIDYSDIALYKDNIFWIYGRFSKPVMSLTKEIYITQRAYDQLPDTKLTDGCTYYIVEG